MSRPIRMRNMQPGRSQPEDQLATASAGLGDPGPWAGLSFDVELSITPRGPGMGAPEPPGGRPPGHHHSRDFRSMGCPQIGLTQQQGGGWTMDVNTLMHRASVEASDIADITYGRQGVQPMYGFEESCRTRGESYLMPGFGHCCPECNRIGQLHKCYPIFGQGHGLSSMLFAKHHGAGQQRSSMQGAYWNPGTLSVARKASKSQFAPCTDFAVRDDLPTIHHLPDPTISQCHQHLGVVPEVWGPLGALADMGTGFEASGLPPRRPSEYKSKESLDITRDILGALPPDDWCKDLPPGVLYRRGQGEMRMNSEYHQYQGISNILPGYGDAFCATDPYAEPGLRFQSHYKALFRQPSDMLYCNERWLTDSVEMPSLQATQKPMGGTAADQIGGETPRWASYHNSVCELACNECLPKESSCTLSAATTRASYDFLSSRWFDSEPREQHLLLLSTHRDVSTANAYLLQTKLPGGLEGLQCDGGMASECSVHLLLIGE